MTPTHTNTNTHARSWIDVPSSPCGSCMHLRRTTRAGSPTANSASRRLLTRSRSRSMSGGAPSSTNAGRFSDSHFCLSASDVTTWTNCLTSSLATPVRPTCVSHKCGNVKCRKNAHLPLLPRTVIRTGDESASETSFSTCIDSGTGEAAEEEERRESEACRPRGREA